MPRQGRGTEMSKEYSEREARLLEKERSINAELDAKLALNIDKFPKAVYFIIPSELSERFCFFGIKNLLNQYLKAGFGYESHYAKSQVHLFNGFANLFPLAGAAISDSFLGKYHTIVYFSIAYLAGCVMLSVFSINGVLGQFGSYPYFGYIIPALLITFGSGGIKPCLSAQGGDQFLRVQISLIDRFYSFFYVAATMGMLLSQAVTPMLKNQVRCFDSPCYLLAFGFPSFIFLVSMALFIGGRRYYRIVPAQKEFLPLKAAKVAFTAARRWLGASSGERVEAGHWLRFAEGEYGPSFVEETRLFLKTMVIFMPTILYFMLHDQYGTEWQNQYEKMDKVYLGLVSIPTEVSSNIKPLLILIATPFLGNCVYPLLEKFKVNVCLVNRLIWGFFFALAAFITSTVLGYYVDEYAVNMVIEENVVVSCEGCLNGAWQLPQWILLSFSDAIFFPSGMQFAYTQVGPQMKAFSFSIFLLTTSLGNYLVLMLEGPLQKINSESNRQWVYILVSSISFVIFVLLSKCWFVSKEDEERLKVQQTNVEIFMKPVKSESMYSLEMF